MKKYILPALFVLSLAINAFFIGMHILGKQQKEAFNRVFDIKPVPYPDGLKSLFQKLETKAPHTLKEHDYAFVYTWDTLTAIGSRLGHLRYLDSLFATREYAAMDKVLISEMPQDDLETYMHNHHIRFRSFTLIADADDFISSVFTLKKAKSKSHPMELILNKKGELLYYNARLSGIEEKDSTLYNIHQIITP